MHVEGETTIDRPREAVFDYVARAERLPEYVTEFASVAQESPGEPALGTTYRYELKRGQAKGTFDWTEFERPAKLAWHGPPAKSGPGSMEPSGWWELTEDGAKTRVKLVMTPQPGGLFKLFAPFMAMSLRRGIPKALERLKERVEGGSTPPA